MCPKIYSTTITNVHVLLSVYVRLVYQWRCPQTSDWLAAGRGFCVRVSISRPARRSVPPTECFCDLRIHSEYLKQSLCRAMSHISSLAEYSTNNAIHRLRITIALFREQQQRTHAKTQLAHTLDVMIDG